MTRRNELTEILSDAREAARRQNGLNLAMLDRRLMQTLEDERLVTIENGSVVLITARGCRWLDFAERGCVDPEFEVREVEARWQDDEPIIMYDDRSSRDLMTSFSAAIEADQAFDRACRERILSGAGRLA